MPRQREYACDCGACEKRRILQRDWFDRNRKKRLAQNAAGKLRRKMIAKLPEPSDEELDRRALESMPWRQSA